MLEQAIIDAEQLKETAQQTAEEAVVERYQDEIREAVEKILEQALIAFTQLTKERNVEIAMKEVPKQIKEIRRAAVSEVFKTDIENMDPETREVFDKVLGYVEKKYISGPMKLAKEIILKNNASS